MLNQTLLDPATFSVVIEREILQKIDKACQRLECSRSYLIGVILDQYDLESVEGKFNE